MTVHEIEELLDETRRLPHAADRVTLHMAIGVLEVARQLAILNQTLAAQQKGSGAPKKTAAATRAGRRK